jgi:hypothetical protein
MVLWDRSRPVLQSRVNFGRPTIESATNVALTFCLERFRQMPPSPCALPLRRQFFEPPLGTVSSADEIYCPDTTNLGEARPSREIKFPGVAYMKPTRFLMLLALSVLAVPALFGQTQRPLSNADIVHRTTQGFDAALIVKDFQASNTDFDTSPQALINLKSAGVDKSVLEAMLAHNPRNPPAPWKPSVAARQRTPPNHLAAPRPDACLRKGSWLL